ncbi:Vacuolar fusion protein mon1 [Ptychographa xylographoides]|nr:Vacuolar fusion protein mon1 [Ptychographa xylographoides]
MGSESDRSTIAPNKTTLDSAGWENLRLAESRDTVSPSDPREEEAQTPRTSRSRRSSAATSEGLSTISEGERPPLPPRPTNLSLLGQGTKGSTLRIPKRSDRPQLQSYATTAISRTDIQTLSFPDGSRETYANSTKSTPSGKSFRFDSPVGQLKTRNVSDGDDSGSLRSYAPVGGGGEVESLLGDILGTGQQSPAWKLLSTQVERTDPFDLLPYEDEEPTADFSREFDELDDLHPSGDNEEELLDLWKSKRKHFLILSSAGKPIYNRHGDDNLISGSIGVVQTIISFYEGAQDQLSSFTAGSARFVIITRGPLYLVAISKLGESDPQLRVQLEALYMQILSTLTLPTLTHLFSNRPSTDLRRPLRGTESLLSALADTFTRGSPSTLLSALECLKIRKSYRQIISNTMMKAKCESLLYGLIVAGGRLVSVIRPRTHSLHPSDLQLIFNMLFEAEGIKAGGGENWIPICLPGFNRNGYLHMYVSFLDVYDKDTEVSERDAGNAAKEEQVAILLISANKESFYDLRKMRDNIVEVCNSPSFLFISPAQLLQELEKNGSMSIIKSAVLRGRSCATEIVPGTVLRHFLYKSRGNLQYVMPTYEPHFTTLLARRR